MKGLLTLVLTVTMVFLMATAAYGVWENLVWLGVDLGQTGREMGYRHEDDVATKIISNQVDGVFTSEIQISSTLAHFTNDSGLYAMVGANISNKLDFVFGAGFNYYNSYSPFLLSGGVKCLVPSQLVVYDIEAFYQILPPLLVRLGYNSHANAIFFGVGLVYN
ncbi:MAG TPA: hypothetical protein GXZ98_10290 [Firmicutes bacterium]|jgi:hypothetical protein|nr:hypothetical protein [Bacillota bacterium]